MWGNFFKALAPMIWDFSTILACTGNFTSTEHGLLKTSSVRYKDNCLVFVQHKMDFQEAMKTCEENDGHLIDMDCATESAIQEESDSRKTNGLEELEEYYWIGLWKNDEDWQWVNNDTRRHRVITSHLFNPSTNFGHCVKVKTSNMEWYRDFCGSQQSFICKTANRTTFSYHHTSITTMTSNESLSSTTLPVTKVPGVSGNGSSNETCNCFCNNTTETNWKSGSTGGLQQDFQNNVKDLETRVYGLAAALAISLIVNMAIIFGCVIQKCSRWTSRHSRRRRCRRRHRQSERKSSGIEMMKLQVDPEIKPNPNIDIQESPPSPAVSYNELYSCIDEERIYNAKTSNIDLYSSPEENDENDENIYEDQVSRRGSEPTVIHSCLYGQSSPEKQDHQYDDDAKTHEGQKTVEFNRPNLEKTKDIKTKTNEIGNVTISGYINTHNASVTKMKNATSFDDPLSVLSKKPLSHPLVLTRTQLNNTHLEASTDNIVLRKCNNENVEPSIKLNVAESRSHSVQLSLSNEISSFNDDFKRSLIIANEAKPDDEAYTLPVLETTTAGQVGGYEEMSNPIDDHSVNNVDNNSASENNELRPLSSIKAEKKLEDDYISPIPGNEVLTETYSTFSNLPRRGLKNSSNSIENIYGLDSATRLIARETNELQSSGGHFCPKKDSPHSLQIEDGANILNGLTENALEQPYGNAVRKAGDNNQLSSISDTHLHEQDSTYSTLHEKQLETRENIVESIYGINSASDSVGSYEESALFKNNPSRNSELTLTNPKSPKEKITLHSFTESSKQDISGIESTRDLGKCDIHSFKDYEVDPQEKDFVYSSPTEIEPVNSNSYNNIIKNHFNEQDSTYSTLHEEQSETTQYPVENVYGIDSVSDFVVSYDMSSESKNCPSTVSELILTSPSSPKENVTPQSFTKSSTHDIIDITSIKDLVKCHSYSFKDSEMDPQEDFIYTSPIERELDSADSSETEYF